MLREGYLFEFMIDMPRSIVWIAFAEAEMMSGWWGEAKFASEPGAGFSLDLLVADGTLAVTGRIERVAEPQLFEVSAPAFGTLSVRLAEVPGGTRGVSTRLTVATDRYPSSVDGSAAVPATARARWEGHIDDLIAVLSGHPVDWDAAERRRGTG